MTYPRSHSELIVSEFPPTFPDAQANATSTSWGFLQPWGSKSRMYMFGQRAVTRGCDLFSYD